MIHLALALALAMPVAAQEEKKPGKQEDKAVVLKKLKDIMDAAAQKGRDYDLIESVVPRTNEEKLLRHIALTKISKALLKDLVTAATYFESTTEARQEGHEIIDAAIEDLDRYLVERLDENSELIDTILGNPRIQEAITRTDLTAQQRAEVLRKEFANSPEAAQQVTDLARLTIELAEQIDQLNEYKRFVQKRESQWTEFTKRVKDERVRAERMLADNRRSLEQQLTISNLPDTLGKIRAMGPAPDIRPFFGDPPPGFNFRLPTIPKDQAEPRGNKSKPVDTESLIKALERINEMRSRAKTNGKEK